MEELYKSWKHHATHLKELHQRKEHKDQQIIKHSTKFEIGSPVMVKNNAHHTFELKCLLDYGVLKILNDGSLLLIMPNGKEGKTNINDIKLYSTKDIVENAWGSIPGFHKKQTPKLTTIT